MLQKTGDNKGAEDQYAIALKISPDDVGVRTSYAKLLEKTGKKTEARAEYKKVLEKSPTFKPASDALAALDKEPKTK